MTSRPRTEQKKRRVEDVTFLSRAEHPTPAQDLGPEEPYLPVMDRARCFLRHPALGAEFEDLRCEHCAKFLTLQCAHIDMFIDDVEDLDED